MALHWYVDEIANLTVTATQQYFEREGEVNLPGSSVTSETGLSLTSGSYLGAPVDVSYYQPWSMKPGLNKTNLSLEFNFVGRTREIEYRNPYASIWCPPALLNE